ncbi:ABC transporter substrate-binding protein [Bariatricus sp. SGI.161]|uniref:ABC transporter substrate-binding protein n=1 Tax=Bariatricus sp. SGI.161 TaxID=3420550 RepID=UPI003D04F197
MWNKESYSRWFSAFLCVVLVVMLLVGCESEEEKKTQNSQSEIKIPMILTVDPSTGKKNEEKVVVKFNEEYDGIYEIDVEWVMETEDEYRQNLKRLNVTDKLPAIITDLRMLPSFYQMMIEDERIEDLSPYILEDDEWMGMIEPVVLDSFRESDGKIYLAPLSTAAFSCSGVFWNEELFEKAGIEEFPETWEEFWNVCERLESYGITPLALHTEGTAWAAMLLATAELSDTPEGAEFMKEIFPESYQNESGLHMAETLKRLFSYTTKDAIGQNFDVSYENFFSGKTAMIPNGYWMIDQIPEGEWEERVRFSPFPGNKLVSSPETFGWSIVSSYSDEVKKGAVEFLKFRTKLNKEEKEELFRDNGASGGQVVQDYIRAYQGNPQIVPNYQVKWNSILQEETLGAYLPDLISGKITPEQFTQEEDKSIEQFEAEQ